MGRGSQVTKSEGCVCVCVCVCMGRGSRRGSHVAEGPVPKRPK